ncbi:MAG: PAS domain S-box protein [Steroidobacteraceae bacterium]
MLSSKLVRNVLDSAPDAMVIITCTGAIRFANYQVTAWFGYSPEELKGRPVETLLPVRFQNRHIKHRENYFSNVRVRQMGEGLDLFARRKDGSEFPVEISLSPIRDEEEVMVVAAIRDITERRHTQIALYEAQLVAERANKAKSHFLATASHDLRQPVQTLALLNGAMRRMVTDPEQREILLEEEAAINGMVKMLNALLDIGKLESGAVKPDLTSFDSSELVGRLRIDFAGMAAEKGLRLEIDWPALAIHTDMGLVEQILRNLITNAIKYTSQGSVTLRAVQVSTGIRLEVVDTGVGIPKNALANIFDEFFQVGIAANSSRNGYGLGLSIVHRLVGLLGLKLDVDSAPGRGSNFSLLVPAGENAQCEDAAVTPALQEVVHEASQAHHILLVEDDPGVRNATRLLLKVEGYRVTTAATIDEARQRASEFRDIELLLTDYHLADAETGLHVARVLRQEFNPDLHVILMTGDTSSAVRAQNEDLAVRMTSKPIKPGELIRLIDEVLGR